MAILPGKRLGPYEIVSSIGGGGMGEVYRAKDTRLDRVVAVKVLPDHSADLPESRERFDREARTIAGLNHPHICVLYDVGHQDGIDYLVMEYLEGETLAQRLLKGSLPLHQVLRFAIEIADALDKAHRSGITHRDLKPANIMLTKSGAKLLDFGLAKPPMGKTVPFSELSTAKDQITAQGTILGTLQYMAPEQLEGHEADARTDIFSLGAVIYEMATGSRAFPGKSNASVISAIMSLDPPPVSSLQPMSPPALDRAVKRCLAKDPDKRWQTASDLREELQWIADADLQPAPAVGAEKKSPRATRRQLALWTLASLLIAAAIGLAVWIFKPAPNSSGPPVTRTLITLPPGVELAGLNERAVVISPDGSRLAFVGARNGIQQVYLRALDSLDAMPLQGTEGATTPFFSPDGQWLGFFADGKLKKVPVSGGAPVILADAATPRGADWSANGTITFAPTTAGVIEQVSDNGGTPQPLTHFARGEASHRLPDLLPGGKTLLFVAGNGTNLRIMSYSFASGQESDLIPAGTQPHYVSSGYLAYVMAGTLMAVPFDAQKVEVTGSPVTVVQNLLQSTPTAAAQFSISDSGSLVYLASSQTNQRNLVWVSRAGAEQPLTAPARDYQSPRLSPDGKTIAVSIDLPEPQVWLYDLARDALTRLTFQGTYNRTPVWTPDGKRIAVISNKDAAQNTYWLMADGSGEMQRLNTSTDITSPTSFSPDGRLLALNQVDPVTQRDIWLVQLSDLKTWPFLRTPFNETSARFSPDGHWIAYTSDESGRWEIYVQPYPGPGGKWQISTDGGTEPVWNPKGRELFYRSDDKMMAVDISTRPAFSAGKPRMLFAEEYFSAPGSDSAPEYDISPDGQRFLMLKDSGGSTATQSQIVVVQNWAGELKRGSAPIQK